MMIPMDMNRATLSQSVNIDIFIPSVAFRVETFKCFRVQG